jgi:hypothetical protein
MTRVQQCLSARREHVCTDPEEHIAITSTPPTDLGRASSPSQISVVSNIEECVRLHRPESVLTLELSRARIVVVAAKRPGRPWDPVARVHIEQARRSYRRLWSEVPLWDRFDDLETTSQYIAYVVYRTAAGHFEQEAPTGRLVRDEPDDVSFYATDGTRKPWVSDVVTPCQLEGQLVIDFELTGGPLGDALLAVHLTAHPRGYVPN